jgi:hypothetical protein
MASLRHRRPIKVAEQRKSRRLFEPAAYYVRMHQERSSDLRDGGRVDAARGCLTMDKFERLVNRLRMESAAFAISVDRIGQPEKSRRRLPNVKTEPPKHDACRHLRVGSVSV